MVIKYYKTNLGLVVKDNDSIRLKSSYVKKIITEDEFNNANPIKISKNEYLKQLNIFFKDTKLEWEHNGNSFKKLDNFEMNKYTVENYNIISDIPFHDIDNKYIGKCMIVLYHGRLYYTFLTGNYFPQMQLIDFFTKEFTGKWTHIKNLAPIFNKTTKKII